MRDYIGTFWCARYGPGAEGEYLVVDKRGDQYVLLELSTHTFHPARCPGWGDTLWMHRFYGGEYFDNMTLQPAEPLKYSQITAL